MFIRQDNDFKLTTMYNKNPVGYNPKISTAQKFVKHNTNLNDFI